MIVKVLSRDGAEAFIPPPRAVCISIRDAGDVRADLHPRFAAILDLEFDDVDPVRYEFLEQAHLECVLFDPRHARAILEFTAQHRDAPLLLVHCNAGVSRSPAVAIGLAGDASRHAELRTRYPHYNMHVLRVLTAARRLGEIRPEP
jgi:predicted protein tyrosine phosphatase